MRHGVPRFPPWPLPLSDFIGGVSGIRVSAIIRIEHHTSVLFRDRLRLKRRLLEVSVTMRRIRSWILDFENLEFHEERLACERMVVVQYSRRV
jgi:hypothetical protein